MENTFTSENVTVKVSTKVFNPAAFDIMRVAIIPEGHTDAARIYTMARDLFARNEEIAQKAFDRWKKEHQN